MLIQKAIILFYDEKGNVLMQDRRTINKIGKSYGFFGGSVEEGETIEQGLVREVREELS